MAATGVAADSKGSSSARGVVTTIKKGWSDPEGITLWTDPKTSIESLLVVEWGNNYVHQLMFNGATQVLMGDGSRNNREGTFKTCALYNPRGVCVDPSNRNRIFVTDRHTIQLADRATDRVAVFAGNSSSGYRDGSSSRFYTPSDAVCTSNGSSVYVCDSANNRLRCVDVKSNSTITVAGDGTRETTDGIGLGCALNYPFRIVFDRSSHVAPDSVLYIAASGKLRKFTIASGEMSTIELPGLSISALDSIAGTGILIVSCNTTYCLYAVNPKTGETQRIAGIVKSPGTDDGDALNAARFQSVNGIVVVASQCAAFVTGGGSVRRVPLPPHLFPAAPPVSGDYKSLPAAAAAAVAAPVVIASASAGTGTGVDPSKLHAACEANRRELESKCDALAKQLALAVSENQRLNAELASANQRINSFTQLQFINAAAKEVASHPVYEWSGAGVLYWVQHVFGVEHNKSTQLAGLIAELTRKVAGAASEVVTGAQFAAFKIRDLRAHKLSDLDTIEILMDSIDALKTAPPPATAAVASGSAASTSTGAAGDHKSPPPVRVLEPAAASLPPSIRSQPLPAIRGTGADTKFLKAMNQST